MKRLFLTTSLGFSLCAGMAFAQQPQQTQAASDPQQQPAGPAYRQHHVPNPQRQAAMLSRRLNLTPDQTSRLEPILATHDQQMQALQGNAQLSPEDRRQQMRSLHQQTEQQLSTVLNGDQMAQLKAMRRHGHHHGEEGAPAPGNAPGAGL